MTPDETPDDDAAIRAVFNMPQPLAPMFVAMLRKDTDGARLLAASLTRESLELVAMQFAANAATLSESAGTVPQDLERIESWLRKQQEEDNPPQW